MPKAIVSDNVIVLSLDNRIYELVTFHDDNEPEVGGFEMLRRAKWMDAELGEDDARFISPYMASISMDRAYFRDWMNMCLIFTKTRKVCEVAYIGFFNWRYGVQSYCLYNNWDRRFWLPRRVK